MEKLLQQINFKYNTSYIHHKITSYSDIIVTEKSNSNLVINIYLDRGIY